MGNTATKTLIILGAFIVLSSTSVFAQNESLSTGRWKLTEAYGKSVTHSSAYIDFDARLTKFTGNTGCNQMFGSVTVRGRSIELRDIGSTKMFCKLMAGNIPESTFLKALNEASRYTRGRNTLNLYDTRGRTILKFKKIAGSGDADNPTATRLGDKRWVLESIKGRQTFAPITGAYLNFDTKKRTVGGNTSCNSFGGNFSSEGNTILISHVISTMRACVEGSKMAVERDLLDGLRNADRYEIRADRLYLYRGSELLLTFRGERK